MTQGAYRLVSRMLAPIVFVYIWWLGRKNPDYRHGYSERWGGGDHRSIARGSIWVHAASMGEMRAAQPLIDRLLEENWPLFITTNTPTGRDAAVKRYGSSNIAVMFSPVDTPGAVARFLDKAQPASALFVELELWPNRLAALARRDIPVALVNARLSEASLKRYSRLGRLMSDCMKGFVCVSAQTDEDAARYRELGVPNEQIHVTGNLKFDQRLNDDQILAGHSLRTRIGSGRPVWVAASLRQAEAEIVRDAHLAFLRDRPDGLLIVVPRHPERFKWPDIDAGVPDGESPVGDRHLLRASESDQSAPISGRVRVLLADTFGEMTKFLAAGDVAFVGGTLAPLGGHNPIEPAALGMPILMGPHVTNFRQVDNLLGACGGRVRVVCARELAESLVSLFGDSHHRQAVGAMAKGLVERHRGATECTLQALQQTILRRQPPAGEW